MIYLVRINVKIYKEIMQLITKKKKIQLKNGEDLDRDFSKDMSRAVYEHAFEPYVILKIPIAIPTDN